jgi:hypothetical protein
MLQEAKNSSYRSLAAESLGLKQKKKHFILIHSFPMSLPVGYR